MHRADKKWGNVFIGLYHKYARKPFLGYFNKLKEENEEEFFS